MGTTLSAISRILVKQKEPEKISVDISLFLFLNFYSSLRDGYMASEHSLVLHEREVPETPNAARIFIELLGI